MPNIRDYIAPQGLGLNPSETGVEATAGAARRIGGFYNQAAGAKDEVASLTNDTGRRVAGAVTDSLDVVKDYEDHREISAGASSFAQLTANLTDQWNATVKNSDPNDTSVAGKFNETVLGPALDKFQGAFSTEKAQAWAEGHADALRTHMFQKASADMSTMAGEAVAVNIKQSENAWTNTARSDPSSVPFLLEQAEHSVGAIISSSPNLSASDAAKIRAEGLQKTKEGIVKAGALGAMEKSADPDKVASSFAERYPDYVNGGEIDQLAKAAQYYKRLNVSEERADVATAQRAAKDDFNKKVNSLEASTMPTTAGARPQLPPDYWSKLRDLSTHPGAALEPTRLKSMVEAGEHLTDRLNKPEPLGPISHDTTMELLGRIRATDPSRLQGNDEIYKAYGDGKLNTNDFNFLQKEYQDMRTPEGQALNTDRSSFFKQYAGAISGSAGYDPVNGSPKLYAAEMAARRQEGDLKKKGLDPHLIYDPTSEYFFGKPANIGKYAGSMQADLATKATAPAATAAPQPNPAARPEPPYELRGVASLSYSPSRKQWRDDTSGKVFNADGSEVKK